VVAGLGQNVVPRRLVRVDTVFANGPAPGSVTVGLAQLRSGDTAHDLIRTRRPCPVLATCLTGGSAPLTHPLA